MIKANLLRAALGLITLLIFVFGGHASARAAEVRSIRHWVVGDGKTDDAVGVARAFAECKKNAFILQVDCHVFIHVGMDISRPLFIDNGTHVEFTKDGLFITDNVLVPAFVLANSTEVDLINWHVEYVGGMPIDYKVGGYYNKGLLVSRDGYAQPAFAFNDLTLTSWLKRNRGIAFDHVSSPWQGPTNTSAMFFFIGDSNNINIKAMDLFVPESAGVDKFIPVVFAFSPGYDNNKTAVAAVNRSLIDVPNVSVPHDIHFENIVLDGYYMGWVGTLQNSTFTDITARRYGDLQDAHGENPGGVGKWFAPPHLFYLRYVDDQHPYDTRLAVRNVAISHVTDLGKRLGIARDRRGEKISGYANSLKIGAVDSTVTDYKSDRPDGLADVLSCDHLTLTNIEGKYNSSFINDVYPGLRFPARGYKNLTLNNVSLTDLSPDPYGTSNNPRLAPIGDSLDAANEHIVMNNVTVRLNKQPRTSNLKPAFWGNNNKIDIKTIVQGK